jgi:Predicted ICC-like phosphoesterases
VAKAKAEPEKLEKFLVVPDVHIPYHNRQSFDIMLNAAKGWGPDGVIIIGDFMDFYAVSDHLRDPVRATKFDWEIAEGNRHLDMIDNLGAEQKIYVAGNHEDRMERYLQGRAPELHEMLKVEELLHLDERGWQYVPYKQHTQAGKVYLTHDVGTAGRYSVFRAIDTFNHSVVTGHSHHMAYIVENDATGETPRVSAQFGWLGDTEQVNYMSRAKARKFWPQGFGYGYLDEAGILYLVPAPIVDGKAVVEGKVYRA